MLFSFLSSLGVHIGSSKFMLKTFYKPFLIGYRNNYCIFNIQKIMFFLKKTLFFFYSLGLSNSLFLFYPHSYIQQNSPITLFFIKEVNKMRGLLFTERWSYGQLSNMYTSCYILFTDIFSFKDILRSNKVYFQYSRLSFYNFFFSLLYFTFYKRVPGMEWETHIKRIEKYWRFFLFFKFYRYLNRFPDAFLYLTNCDFPVPAIESKNLKIPLVGNLDVDFTYHSFVSYPLLGNSQSNLLFLFYFIIFSTFYKKGKYKYYSSLL